MEGRRQFIPREAGDPELTQAELDAQNESAGGKFSKFMKTAAFATMLGAAALSPEIAHAQQPEQEKQRIEQVRNEMHEEGWYEEMLTMMTQGRDAELKPLLEGARFRENEAGSDAKTHTKSYYLYLPSRELVLTIEADDFENEERTKEDLSHAEQRFIVSVLTAMKNSGLIEFVKSPDAGLIRPIPNVLEEPSYNLKETADMARGVGKSIYVNENLPRVISELRKRRDMIGSLGKANAGKNYQFPTTAQEEYPALPANMRDIDVVGDALIQRIDLAIQRKDYQALESIDLVIESLQHELALAQGDIRAEAEKLDAKGTGVK